jgi:hypothetical protein
LTRTDFKVGDALFIDLSGKQEFNRIIARGSTVAKLDEGDAIIEDFKGSFLSFAIEQMAEDEDRLAFAFRAEIFEGVLRRCGAGELTGRICSYQWHERTVLQKLHRVRRI